MCVLAGYIGEKPAAKVLLEMLRREEGLDAGFYTGIATIHEGKLHYRKTVGDVAALLAETDAEDLPGTIGIAHSRTPSGGGREWAHPFTNASEDFAYIANGSRGAYLERIDLAAIGNHLLDQGVTFKSSNDERISESSTIPTLKNGKKVHISDLHCQLIDTYLARQGDLEKNLLEAAIRAYEEIGGEIVGMCVHAQLQDSIIIARQNKPIQIGRDANGDMYLATTALAFPETVWQMQTPPQAGAVCRRDGTVDVVPFNDFSRVLPLGKAPSPQAVAGCVEEYIQTHSEVTVPDLRKTVSALWPKQLLGENSLVVYEMLEALVREGKVKMVEKKIPGMFDEGQVPRTYLEWNCS